MAAEGVALHERRVSVLPSASFCHMGRSFYQCRTTDSSVVRAFFDDKGSVLSSISVPCAIPVCTLNVLTNRNKQHQKQLSGARRPSIACSGELHCVLSPPASIGALCLGAINIPTYGKLTLAGVTATTTLEQTVPHASISGFFLSTYTCVDVAVRLRKTQNCIDVD